jgi:hypothetical protein
MGNYAGRISFRAPHFGIHACAAILLVMSINDKTTRGKPIRFPRWLMFLPRTLVGGDSYKLIQPQRVASTILMKLPVNMALHQSVELFPIQGVRLGFPFANRLPANPAL